MSRIDKATVARITLNMPILANTKHELFAQALAKGETADAAYQAAGYAANRGNATTLKANQSILNRVKELQGKAESVFTMKREEWLESFRRVASKAEEKGDYAATVGALRQIGLALPQWYQPEKVEHDGKLEIVIKKL